MKKLLKDFKLVNLRTSKLWTDLGYKMISMKTGQEVWDFQRDRRIIDPKSQDLYSLIEDSMKTFLHRIKKKMFKVYHSLF